MANKNDALDNLLTETCHKKYDKIDGLKDISIPDVNIALSKFRNSLEKDSNVIQFTKKNKYIWNFYRRNRIISIVASALLILIASSFLSILFESQSVQAIKFNVFKIIFDVKDDLFNITTTNKENPPSAQESPIDIDPKFTPGDNRDTISQKVSLKDLKEKFTFPVAIPRYMPDGFSFKEGEWTVYRDSTNIVNQVYFNNSVNSSLVINQMTNVGNISLKTVTPKQNIVTQYKIMDVEGVIISSEQKSFQAIWIKDNYKFNLIATNIEEAQFYKVLDNLK